MKIKRSELNNLILEVTQNNQISKNIALIIDKQGVDIDEAVTIYIKDNPSATEASVTQALTDFPISNGMDKAFVAESIDEVIDAVIKEIEDEEEDDLDPVGEPIDDPIGDEESEEPEEFEEPEEVEVDAEVEGLYGGKQKFNPDVQRALAIINQVVNEPREYYALMNGQETPEGKPKYPGVLKMVVMNPREKRRAMRVILGKRLGDLVMDYLESNVDSLQESFKDSTFTDTAGGDDDTDTELGNSDIGMEDEPGDSDKLKADVARVLQYMSKVDTKVEYAQLIDAVLSFDFSSNAGDKKMALKKILGNTIGSAVIRELGL